jgi:hypothetical protein
MREFAPRMIWQLKAPCQMFENYSSTSLYSDFKAAIFHIPAVKITLRTRMLYYDKYLKMIARRHCTTQNMAFL